jgi:hypothetical protein
LGTFGGLSSTKREKKREIALIHDSFKPLFPLALVLPGLSKTVSSLPRSAE